ncbi:MAG: GntR family transcriptional regulator [Bacillota bacterium]|nr:GntR family transcriptional regulator [Bacillota bacterium]
MIVLDLKDKRPLYIQVIDGIEDLALKGVLKPNEQLPSVRSLAVELSINPNTIQRAYLELEKRGTTYSIQGKGSFINEDFERLTTVKKEHLFKEFDALLEKAITLGLTQDELFEAISSAYCRHCQSPKKEGEPK